jgi:CRP/FNR family transcriptional regulator, cyclic AMP receptor protein
MRHEPDPLAAFIDLSSWGRSLTTVERQRVLAALRTASFGEGECIVRAGFAAEHWVGVMEGLGAQSVTLASGDTVLLSAGLQGSWFGEGTLIKGGCWGYDAVAIRRTQVALLPAATFRWLRDSSLAFNHFLQRLLNDRLAVFTALAVHTRSGTAVDRLALVLWHLSSMQAADSPREIRISQAELGLLAGLSRQRTNRALGELRERGLVQLLRGGVAVPDAQSLRRALLG